MESDCRDLAGTKVRSDNSKTNSITQANFKGSNTTSNMLYGLNDDDNVGLQLEERKGEVN